MKIVADFDPVPVSKWADDDKHDINIRKNAICIPKENRNECKAGLEGNREISLTSGKNAEEERLERRCEHVIDSIEGFTFKHLL